MNTALITELDSEHAALAQKLAQIDSIGTFNEATRNLLKEVKTGLVAHLGKEEEELYPFMRRSASNNPDLHKVMLEMSLDMDVVALKAMQFLDTWIEKTDSSGFMQEFKVFYELLAHRIEKEEQTLYAEYNRLAQKNK